MLFIRKVIIDCVFLQKLGVPLEGKVRVQLNLKVDQSEHIESLKKFRNFIFPVIWLEEVNVFGNSSFSHILKYQSALHLDRVLLSWHRQYDAGSIWPPCLDQLRYPFSRTVWSWRVPLCWCMSLCGHTRISSSTPTRRQSSWKWADDHWDAVAVL